MRNSAHILATALIILVAGAPVASQVPRGMSFQGVLLDHADTPVDGTETIVVRLFDAESSGTEVWNRTYNSHPVNDGRFDITFSGGSPAFSAVPFLERLWVELEVDGEEITPRTPLIPAPYAMGLSLPIDAAQNIAGINTSAFKITNTAVSGANTAISGVTSSTTGIAVSGWAQATTGFAYGVSGESASSTGRGVSGMATSQTGTTYGVYGQSSAQSGRGVSGLASSVSGSTNGVYGEASSTEGHGVHGEATAATGTTYGVYGRSSSASGSGVYGANFLHSGITYGVHGVSNSTAGRGVYGKATAGGSLNFGVYGETVSSSGWAGFFIGGRGIYTTGSDNSSPDLVLGGTSGSDDDGRIFSDPSLSGSDIWLHSNDAVVIKLDSDGDGEDADFEIRDKDDVNIFNVDNDGTVTVDGVVTHSSDRNRKEGIVPVDAAQILQAVARLPIHNWRFKGQSVPHVGPMAQDFYSQFSVGADDTHIAGVDADGVALAAIQGLYELLLEQKTQLARQQAEIDLLRRAVLD